VNWIRAGINPWAIATQDGDGAGHVVFQTPTSTVSDSGIGVSFNLLNLNPNFQNPYGVTTTLTNCNLATWNADTQSGPADEESALASLRANPSLVKLSLLPYLRSCYTPILSVAAGNCALNTAGYASTSLGAVPPNASACGTQ
jgi:hypothetical protein